MLRDNAVADGTKEPTMPWTRAVLQTDAGVTLTEVILTNGGGVTMAVAYKVSSQRTAEVRSSHTAYTAEKHFAEEVARCRPPSRDS